MPVSLVCKQNVRGLVPEEELQGERGAPMAVTEGWGAWVRRVTEIPQRYNFLDSPVVPYSGWTIPGQALKGILH